MPPTAHPLEGQMVGGREVCRPGNDGLEEEEEEEQVLVVFGR
jgi:hypothetical protein